LIIPRRALQGIDHSKESPTGNPSFQGEPTGNGSFHGEPTGNGSFQGEPYRESIIPRRGHRESIIPTRALGTDDDLTESPHSAINDPYGMPSFGIFEALLTIESFH
jgi:hypothetical protein